ncbi:type III-B CRISPR module RAMP protein Cmr4 [Roseibacillus ishigakijimensis]|uniref:Type III-B CRISPR module RAMP protein Cmr4 n=1 Tax=Roseibacillus ishigakijimensis TaxID=454146 RepID=A0A934RNR2_9BACT|nr:type III-B CRISPR module RAMP protein Cmr4 [Roseibacillus ishigakijimensis]MBK1832766.1 type III-B CRISPR module RAMP protein Cmr4 [Roseibacillus ishigakijimensis]
MKTKLLYIFTRTPLHVGVGSSVGAVDLPIRRERHTNHPIIPGSSIKGVFRDCASHSQDTQSLIRDLFGPDNDEIDDTNKAQAGDLAFGEARPIAFPVRSAKGAFAYVTCPFVLQRFAREANLPDLSDLPQPNDQTCLAGKTVSIDNPAKRVVLEEYAFEKKEDFPAEWQTALLSLSEDPVWQEAKDRLVLLSDGDFAHFVTTTTEISTQTKINPETGAVAKGALFNMECIPAETLFAAPVQIIGRYKDTDSEAGLAAIVENNPIMQFGGNSTTGRGFCSITLK